MTANFQVIEEEGELLFWQPSCKCPGGETYRLPPLKDAERLKSEN